MNAINLIETFCLTKLLTEIPLGNNVKAIIRILCRPQKIKVNTHCNHYNFKYKI